MAECKHGLEPDWCSLCNQPRASVAIAHHDTATWDTTGELLARYDGTCPECGFPIATGQLIARQQSGTTRRYVHSGCA